MYPHFMLCYPMFIPCIVPVSLCCRMFILCCMMSSSLFFSVIYFDQKSEDTTFCQECSKFIIVGDEFEQKFPKILEEIPDPPSETKTKAREEFKNIVQSLLFLASSEPVITPKLITPEVAHADPLVVPDIHSVTEVNLRE